MPREKLADRRPCEIFDFIHTDGRKYTATIGRYPDGRLAEVFMFAGKIGSDAAVNARDCSIALSLLLQHGCTSDAVGKSLSRTTDGIAESPIGALLDLLADNDNG